MRISLQELRRFRQKYHVCLTQKQDLALKR